MARMTGIVLSEGDLHQLKRHLLGSRKTISIVLMELGIRGADLGDVGDQLLEVEVARCGACMRWLECRRLQIDTLRLRRLCRKCL
jgi:hypothetical protein